jgi:hypothetical protein
MSEPDPYNRVPFLGATVVDVIATGLDGESTYGPMAPAASTDFVAAVPRDGTDLSSTGLVLLVLNRLEQHPHFRGRSSLFNIELVGDTIVMKGRFPSYYLKQLLQEAIKVMPEVVNMDNQVHVIWPNFLWAERREGRVLRTCQCPKRLLANSVARSASR